MAKKKTKILIASYVGAALIALSLFAGVCYSHLEVYRRQTRYDASRAFEETVGAIDRLSRSLEKSLYAADGGMCGKVCAEIYADARTAETAMSALPFSTVEYEQIKTFLGLTQDYAYTLCREAAEQGFTDEQRQNLANMSDTAAELAAAMLRMQGGVNDGLITMDSREAQVRNVDVPEQAKLSAEIGAYESEFTGLAPLSYDGRYTAREDTPAPQADEETCRSLAAEVLGVLPEGLTLSAEYADGSCLSYSFGTRTVCVTADGVESLSDSRLVSEETLSAAEGVQAAETLLGKLGYENMELCESWQNGAVLNLRYAENGADSTSLDRTLRLAVALDDGSLYALDASGMKGEEPKWDSSISEEEAQSLLPEGLTLSNIRRVTVNSPGGHSVACYELDCTGEKDREVKLYLNAETGKQQDIVIS